MTEYFPPYCKALPAMGGFAVHVRAKNEEDIETINLIEDLSQDIRNQHMHEGKHDEAFLLQPTHSPTLFPGDKMKCSFRRSNEDNH